MHRFSQLKARVGAYANGTSSGSIIFYLAASQVALLSVTPVLTREFTVRQISIYQLGFAVALVFQSLSTLRTELVIPVRTYRAAKRLRNAAYVANLCTSGLLCAIGLVCYAYGPRNGVIPAIFVSAGLIIGALGNTAIDNSWLVRKHATRTMAIRNLLTGAFGGAFQVVAALILPLDLSLAAALAAGRLVAVAVTLPRRDASPTDALLGSDRPYTIRRALASIGSLSLSSLALQMPVLVAAVTLTAEQAGQISLAQRIAGVPASLLAAGVAQYLTARASSIIRAEGRVLGVLVSSVARRLVLLGLSAAPLLAVAGPVGVPLVLGDQWQTAGYALAILAVPFALQLTAFPMVAIFGLLGQDTRILILQATRSVALLAVTLAAALLSRSVLVTAGAAAFAITVSYLAIISGAKSAAHQYDAGHLDDHLEVTPVDADPFVPGEGTDAAVVLTAERFTDRPAKSVGSELQQGRGKPRRPSDTTALRFGPTVVPARSSLLTTYLLTVIVVTAFGFGIFSRKLLPSRYFNDDARLQQFIAFPSLVTRDGSYRATASLYRALALGGHPATVAVVALVLFNLGMLRVVSQNRVRGVQIWVLASVGIGLAAIYLAPYSKEFFLLPLMIALLWSRTRRVHVLFIILALLYGVFVRTYWLAVVALYLVNCFVLPRLAGRRSRLLYLTGMVIVAAAGISSGIGNSFGYTRISTLANLSFDPTTAIATPLSGGVFAGIGNQLYVAVTLVVPLPLLGDGVIYIVAAAFLGACWLAVCRSLGQRLSDLSVTRTADSRVWIRCVCFLPAYVTILAMFEPDYGSYLRHMTPFLPVFVAVLAGASYRAENDAPSVLVAKQDPHSVRGGGRAPAGGKPAGSR